jgi:SNF2 family DNA or RNA helicase
MVNRVAELWAYLHIFDPNKFDNLRKFERAFNIYQEMGGKVQTGKILDLCLKDRMVHRNRNEVGLQLPELTIEIRDLEYNEQQQEVADQMKKQFYIWLDEQQEAALTATAIIAQLLRLRQISVWPVFQQTRTDDYGNELVVKVDVQDSCKIDEAMDIIEEANDQVVLFCNFNEPLAEIQRRCRSLNLRCEVISGATSRTMDQMEVGFQQGEIDVLCINSSMGEGLNLQKNPDQWPGGAAIGIHLDRWWNPARDTQCNGRIHRQGANIPVTIYMLHTPGSVDDFVAALSDEKAELFEGIMSDSRIRPAFQWKEEIKKLMGD